MERQGARKHMLSLDAVMYFVRVHAMKETVGATPFGGDLNRWPSRLVDVFVLLQGEHARVEKMRNVAIPPHPTPPQVQQQRTRR